MVGAIGVGFGRPERSYAISRNVGDLGESVLRKWGFEEVVTANKAYQVLNVQRLKSISLRLWNRGVREPGCPRDLKACCCRLISGDLFTPLSTKEPSTYRNRHDQQAEHTWVAFPNALPNPNAEAHYDYYEG